MHGSRYLMIAHWGILGSRICLKSPLLCKKPDSEREQMFVMRRWYDCKGDIYGYRILSVPGWETPGTDYEL